MCAWTASLAAHQSLLLDCEGPDGSVTWRTGRYQVSWRLDDGTQGAKSFDARGPARDFKNELLAQVAADAGPTRAGAASCSTNGPTTGGSSGPPAPGAAPRAWRPRKVTCGATCAPTLAADNSARSPPRSFCAGNTTWRASSATAA